MDKRKFSLEKYGISKKRYKELCGFCEQYPEWKEELSETPNSVKGVRFDKTLISKTNTKNDPTADMSIRRIMLEEKVKLIEDTAKEADMEFWKEIIKSVCYGTYYFKLEENGIAICDRSFRDRKRYFFYLLNQKKT